jgi:hypothetical protein
MSERRIQSIQSIGPSDIAPEFSLTHPASAISNRRTPEPRSPSMQQPLFNTPVAKCETLARHIVASIRRYIALFSPTAQVRAELEAIAARIAAGSLQLVSAHGVYRERVLDLIEPRVEVKMVDLKADDVVRSVKRLADEAKVADRIFPDGVTPIVKPVGQSEVDELQKLEERISGSIGWADKDAAQARIASVRADYETALGRRRAALSASGSARALRDSTREEFVNLYASAMGTVKALFPRDKATQDAFFDAVRTASDDGDDEAEPS